MARMLTQVPLPLLPGDAAEIAPGVGMVTGPDGSGVMWVHGLATFAWDAGDEAGRRLAAVQLWKLKAATQAQVAEAFGVIPVSVWRWEKALRRRGRGPGPGPQGPAAALQADPRRRGADPGTGPAGPWQSRDRRRGRGVRNRRFRSVLRPAEGGRRRWFPARAPGRPLTRLPASRRRPRAGRRGRCRCCLTRWRGTASGCWPGSGCWARAPSRCSPPVPGIRWPGCCWRCPRWRAPGCWSAPGLRTAGCGTGFTGWR